MSPYLLLGFTAAGILRVLIPDAVVLKYLSGNKWRSVLNASLVGVPLPLCSCGVLPITAHLSKMGVKRGPLLSFLTSTPTTGVDSILATYSLMGGLFTLLRVLASFTIGVFSGIIANLFLSKEDLTNKKEKVKPSCCSIQNVAGTTFNSKMKSAFNYAYVDLINDIAKWLIIGIVSGGLINYFVPESFISEHLSNPFISYGLMSLIGLPMYICSTGSIPIAMSLIMKGMNPGAGLVFLIAGPATNTATMSFIAGKFGIKTLVVYLLSIIAGSVAWGIMLDSLWPHFGYHFHDVMHHVHENSSWGSFKTLMAVILCALLLNSVLSKLKNIAFLRQ